MLVWGHAVTLVDWKSAGGTLTPKQQKMVARGFPIRYVSTTAQLDALRSELMR